MRFNGHRPNANRFKLKINPFFIFVFRNFIRKINCSQTFDFCAGKLMWSRAPITAAAAAMAAAVVAAAAAEAKKRESFNGASKPLSFNKFANYTRIECVWSGLFLSTLRFIWVFFSSSPIWLHHLKAIAFSSFFIFFTSAFILSLRKLFFSSTNYLFKPTKKLHICAAFTVMCNPIFNFVSFDRIEIICWKKAAPFIVKMVFFFIKIE